MNYIDNFQVGNHCLYLPAYLKHGIGRHGKFR